MELRITREKLVWGALIVLILLGGYMRSWHLDFPSIGYHNMKENEYLVPAYYFYSGDWEGMDILRRPYYLCGVDQIDCYFEEYPQVPLMSWAAALGWLVLGLNFWWPRLLMVGASVGTIIALFYLVRQLSRSTYLALLSAFIFTILPLSVFFGRNFQPESPALLFAVLGTYYFAKWVDNPSPKSIVWSGVWFCMAAMFKMTFLIAGFPLLFIFPWERLKQKQYYRQFVYFGLCFLPFLLWNFVLSGALNTAATLGEHTFKRVDLFRVFGSEYWNQFTPTLKNYTRDNFAGWYFKYALLGLLAMLLTIRSKLSRYTWGYALALIPYLMILADYFKGHSYYQFPFLPVVAVASAYFIFVLGKLLSQFIKFKYVLYLPLLLLIPTFGVVGERTDVQYDTLFYGLDAGGEYINQHTEAGDVFWMVGHSQTVGVCFAAKRVCPGLPRTNLTMIKQGEKDHDIEYMFVHGGMGIAMLQEFPDTWEHVRNNYELVALGFFNTQPPQPQFYILKKGGTFDPNAHVTGPTRAVKKYTTKNQGEIELLQMEFP
ncbi:hypothetical protein CMO91_04190 [Candidatus Woesearchaeota archaeon]|nr:hypothetical protein [Candidatus Woesearchaeota archaeon]